MYLFKAEMNIDILKRNDLHDNSFEITADKTYDIELDDATSVIFDICDCFYKQGIKFKISGFGDDNWPADCRFDLPSIIEDLCHRIINKINYNDYNFELQFEEQGLQRNISVKDKGDNVILKCQSHTDWIPNPASIEMTKEEFKSIVAKLYNGFVVNAKEQCPVLVVNPLVNEWMNLTLIK